MSEYRDGDEGCAASRAAERMDPANTTESNITAEGPLLEIRDVSYRFAEGTPAVLSGVSLDISPGEMVAIVGPNGAGKSTLLRACAGLLRPESGSVRVDGRRMEEWKRKDLARRVALVPQDLSVPFSFTVEELALMGRAPHLGRLGLERAADLALVEEVLSEMELSELASRPIDRLSGGERQRAFIARAMAQDPRVLLCDEPTAHLDLRHQRRLFDALRGRANDRNLGILLVLHDLNLAAGTCDRLILLDRGAVACFGEPSFVLRPEVLEAVYRTPLVTGVEATSGRPFVLQG